MKVFKVRVDNFSYDDFDSCVIVAESEDAVCAMTKSGIVYTSFNAD